MYSSRRRHWRVAARAAVVLAALGTLVGVAPQAASAAPSQCTVKATSAEGASVICRAGYGFVRVKIRCGNESGDTTYYGPWQARGFYSQQWCTSAYPWRHSYTYELTNG